jgi:cell wall-associated NlpC family hydrolase
LLEGTTGAAFTRAFSNWHPGQVSNRREGRLGVRRERRRILCGLLLALAISVASIAPAAADTNLTVGGQASVAKTNGDGVNVRDSAGYSAKIITSVAEGTTVSVLGGPKAASDGTQWYNVEVGGVKGWIVSDYLVNGGGGGGGQAQAASAGTMTVVNTDGTGVRLRDAPSKSGTTLTVVPEGAVVKEVGANKTDGGGTVWANISYNGKTGYSAADYLAEGGTASAAPAATAQVSSAGGLAVGDNAEIVNTNGDGLNLRSDPSYNSGVIAVAPEGSVVRLLDGPTSAGGINWWSVDFKGSKGWMHGGYLTKTDKKPTQAASTQSVAASAPTTQKAASSSSSVGDQIAATAMKYLGAPYVWGGTTPAGFDCSGFTYFVVNQVIGGGFSRDMETQAASGSYVDKGSLQPGDIVFQQNTYKWGLSHTGIYIGNGQFINAANENTGVVISNLNDSYWGPRYYTARRIR